MRSTIQQRDLDYIWHPCSQMKDYADFPLLEVVAASGPYLELKDGKKIIDAISSWWCKSLGHGHPRLRAALTRQMEKFEHVILAGTTNETIVALSEQLAMLLPPLSKSFYASDGSCAVEIAMKMSLHMRQISGEKKRRTFLALQNGYHGETIGALSVSDVGIYKQPYSSLLFPCHYITSVPYVSGEDDTLWQDCSAAWEEVVTQLQPFQDSATALILEPIAQGAGGMKIYSQDFLRRLRTWTAEHGIHLIADEIMTGLGRTGKMLACQHANIVPDFLCLSKGLTSGWLPLSVVLTKQAIYDVFYDDYETGKSFLHSHTYAGNALAASVALEVLKVITEEKIIEQGVRIGKQMRKMMEEIAVATHLLTNVRSIGAIVAADLIDNQSRSGFKVHKKALTLGAMLRPLGNTLYWLPPLNTDDDALALLKIITQQAIQADPKK